MCFFLDSTNSFYDHLNCETSTWILQQVYCPAHTQQHDLCQQVHWSLATSVFVFVSCDSIHVSLYSYRGVLHTHVHGESLLNAQSNNGNWLKKSFQSLLFPNKICAYKQCGKNTTQNRHKKLTFFTWCVQDFPSFFFSFFFVDIFFSSQMELCCHFAGAICA